MTNQSNPIQVADRIFAVIELLAANGAMGLIEISKNLDLNKTTVHRILNSLIYMGYVVQDDKNSYYRLSYKICQLSEQLLNKIELTKMIRPYLRELVQETGETVHLVQMEGNDAVYIDKIESTTNSIRLISQLGRHLPLYSSGVGKALLADLSKKRVEEIWTHTNIVSLTPHTITDYNQLEKNLSEIRKQGYALDNEENETGIRCIAASLGTSSNPSDYAFSISAPVYRMNDQRIKALSTAVLKTKERVLEPLSKLLHMQPY